MGAGAQDAPPTGEKTGLGESEERGLCSRVEVLDAQVHTSERQDPLYDLLLHRPILYYRRYPCPGVSTRTRAAGSARSCGRRRIECVSLWPVVEQQQPPGVEQPPARACEVHPWDERGYNIAKRLSSS